MVDPTEDELRGINNLDDAQAWSGVDGVLARTLNAALGDPARVREIALIPRPIWDDAVDNLEIQEGGDPAPAPMATYAGGECPGGVTSTSLLHSVGKTGGPPR